MGWGTFIAGQAISNIRRAGRTSSSSSSPGLDFEAMAKRRQIFEEEVLKEIQRLKAQGKEVDIAEVRADLKRIRRAYEYLGPTLKAKTTRIAQQRALAGQPVDLDEIEWEIISAYKPIPWGKVALWVFFPYIALPILIAERSGKKKE